MAESRLLISTAWEDGVPHIRLRDGDERTSRLVPVAGLRLNYRVEGSLQKTCLGHVPFRDRRGAYYDCDRPPIEGKRVCARCAVVEATFASNLHHAHTRGSAELDPAVRDHLQQPNRLYLAAFRDGSIKVGTTTRTRTQKRLEEQGAWKARLLAETTNGIAVRSLEDLVTEVWAIPQAVNGSRKLKGLIAPLPDVQVDAQLDETAQRVFELIDRAPDDRVTPLPGLNGRGEPWSNPNAGHPRLSGALPYPLPLDRGNHDLNVITAIGRALFVHRSGGEDVFAIDPSKIFGVQLDVGEYGSDEIAIQDSLF